MARLTLDRDRRLSFTWGAIKRLHREHGINFLALMESGEEWWMNPTTFSAVLWAGLVEDDATLTVDVVDGLITLPRLPRIVEALLAAIGETAQEGEQSANPPTPSPS